MFESLNKKFSNPFDITIVDGEFYKLSQLELDKVYEVVSMYINPRGKHGEYACLGIYIDLGVYGWVIVPNHLIEAVKTILDNPEYIKAVNEKHLGITVRKYHSKKYDKDCYTVDFKDI